MRQYSSNDRPQGTTWSNVNIGVEHFRACNRTAGTTALSRSNRRISGRTHCELSNERVSLARSLRESGAVAACASPIHEVRSIETSGLRLSETMR